jgi:hypothetical protein
MNPRQPSGTPVRLRLLSAALTPVKLGFLALWLVALLAAIVLTRVVIAVVTRLPEGRTRVGGVRVLRDRPGIGEVLLPGH